MKKLTVNLSKQVQERSYDLEDRVHRVINYIATAARRDSTAHLVTIIPLNLIIFIDIRGKAFKVKDVNAVIERMNKC